MLSLSFYTLQRHSHWLCFFPKLAAERRDFPTKDALYSSASCRPLAVSAHSSWQKQVALIEGMSSIWNQRYPWLCPFQHGYGISPWPQCSVDPLGLGRVQMAERTWPCCQDSCAYRTCSDKKASHPVSWGSRHLPVGAGVLLGRNSLISPLWSQLLKSKLLLHKTELPITETMTVTYMHGMLVSPWYCAICTMNS